MALGGSTGRKDGTGYSRLSQSQQGTFKEVEVVGWGRSMDILRNSDVTLKAVLLSAAEVGKVKLEVFETGNDDKEESEREIIN